MSNLTYNQARERRGVSRRRRRPLPRRRSVSVSAGWPTTTLDSRGITDGQEEERTAGGEGLEGWVRGGVSGAVAGGSGLCRSPPEAERCPPTAPEASPSDPSPACAAPPVESEPSRQGGGRRCVRFLGPAHSLAA